MRLVNFNVFFSKSIRSIQWMDAVHELYIMTVALDTSGQSSMSPSRKMNESCAPGFAAASLRSFHCTARSFIRKKPVFGRRQR